MAKLQHAVQKKQHRERSQVNERSKFGFLEKHKDYVKRARDYHKKQNTLKVLRSKVTARNPDEYYHAMNSKKIGADGMLVTQRYADDGVLTTDQVKLLKTQDTNYVRTLRLSEMKKSEKLRNDVMFHASGKHTVFVDDQDQLRNFNPEEFFNTTADLLDRRENRLSKEQLTQQDSRFVNLNNADNVLMPRESLQKKKFKKLKTTMRHIEREQQLAQVEQRMNLQREVMKKGSKKKIVDDKGNVSFKWKKQRKR